jgi:TonB family protein
MKKLLLIFLLLTSLRAISQEKSALYFSRDNMLLPDSAGAYSKREVRDISKKKFEVISFSKRKGKWTRTQTRRVFTRKKDNKYNVDHYTGEVLRRTSKIEVVDTIPNGFVIKEFEDGFCFREAEVKSVFPKVLHGKCKFFSKRKKDVPAVGYFYNGIICKSVKQPKVEHADSLLSLNKKGDRFPKYPGGVNKLYADLSSFIDLPESTTLGELEKPLLVSFIVDSVGRIINPEIINGVGSEVEGVVVGAFMKHDLPWIPAIRDKKRIDFKYILPISLHVKSDGLKNVEKMPEYPGGDLALRKFIAQNVSYPVDAQKQRIQGKVYVTFVININGDVEQARVARGVHPSLDAEALRVVKAMKKWTPGMQDGEKVNVNYTVPINFRFQ